MAAATGVLYKAPAFYDHMHLVSKEVATVTNLLIETGATSVWVVGKGEKQRVAAPDTDVFTMIIPVTRVDIGMTEQETGHVVTNTRF